MYEVAYHLSLVVVDVDICLNLKYIHLTILCREFVNSISD